MENLLLGNVIESGNISPFSCPFCGYNGSFDLMGADRFPVLRTLQVIGAGRRAARCPKCKSSDKERLVYTYLKEVEKENIDPKVKLLLFMPAFILRYALYGKRLSTALALKKYPFKIRGQMVWVAINSNEISKLLHDLLLEGIDIESCIPDYSMKELFEI